MQMSILQRRKAKAAALVAALTAPIAGFEGIAQAQNVVNPGDVVVEQVGNGSAALTNASTAVFLDLFTPVVNLSNNAVTLSPETTAQIALPTTSGGVGLAANPLTTSGTATSEGEISVSPDGSTIVVSGYDANAGSGTSISASNSTTTPREVGLVSVASGAIDTSTTTTAFNANNIRSSVLLNSTTIYAAGATSPGLTQLTVDANATTNGIGTELQSTVVNIRSVMAYNGNVYASDSSGSAVNVFQITGYNGTANSGAAAQLSGLSVSNNATQNTSGYKIFAPYTFAFANSGSTLYVADQGGNGNNASGTGVVEKFTLIGSTYTAAGFVAVGTSNVTGVTVDPVQGSGGTFNAIFVTTPSNVYEISDTSSSLTGDTLNTEETVGTNEAYRGIAADIATPEPTSVSAFVLAGGAGLLRRRRHRLPRQAGS